MRVGGFRMPKRISTKHILMACQLSFDGMSNGEIAKKFEVTDATVSNWRKLELWQEFEAELIDAYKQQVLSLESAAPP